MGKSNSSVETEIKPAAAPSPLDGIEVKVDTPEPTADELGRLRDILFGSQSRTLEKRLSDLEVWASVSAPGNDQPISRSGRSTL